MTGTYEIIYADPRGATPQRKCRGAAENHYPTMSIDELCALPVAELAAATAPFSCGPRSRSSQRPCGSSVRGALPIKASLLSGSKRTKRRIAGFMGWASGRGPTPRSACWQPRDTQSGRPPIFTSLSFRPSRPTAKAGRNAGQDRCPSWATGPAWSCCTADPPGWDVWGNEVEPTAGLWSRWPEDSGKEDVSCPM